ncbi:MAG: type VI secretion protein IcmF/TssM N-terminal domain-containing protein [Desulfomonilia bacterium]
MKQNILLYVLIAVSVLLVLLLSFGLVLGLGWPWWVVIFLLIGFAGVGLVALVLRKLWLRRREQYFVSQIIEQDEAYLKSLKDDEKKQVTEIQDRWKEAVDALKKSHLKKQGNPLYVLPWYLVLGESGSGKTTAIKSARLSSPFAEINRISGFSGTKNCDWWFFEQAIILDTAGRYAIPIDEGRDKEEWEKFLSLLVKYRKREPLNGLVVTVPADKLLESTPELLSEDARNIRRRIDELMLSLGARFPIYVLVTKCDLVQGMTQFCDHLPERQQEQAMGVINHANQRNPETFLKSLIHTINEKLRTIRLLQLHKMSPRELDPALLLFPEEFSRVEDGLAAFLNGVFQENPYQESPLLRGVYFSSGCQEGSPYSHFLKTLGLIEERDVLPGTSKGLFLHDFFARILPRERHLFAPTQRAIEWSRLTRNLGLLSWLAIAIAICGLLSFAFVKNLAIMRSIPHEPPVLKGELVVDVSMLERYRQVILEVEGANRGWLIPRFGLDESEEVEVRLKERYISLVNQGIISSMDAKLEADLAVLDASIPDTTAAPYIIHLARRINLIHGRINGMGLDELRQKQQPSYLPFIPQAGSAIAPEMAENLANLYLYRLIWDQNPENLNAEMNTLQNWLAHVLSKKKTDLKWAAVWINDYASLTGVTLKDFWGGSKARADEPYVPPVFTVDGNKNLDAIIEEVGSALVDPLILSPQKTQFQQWYQKGYLSSWQNFANNFSQGADKLTGKEEWEQVVSKIASGQGPYRMLLDRMDTELEQFIPQGDELPSWMVLVFDVNEIADQASQMAAASAAGSLLTKATKAGGRIKDKLKMTEGMESGAESKAITARMNAVKAYASYQTALDEISSTIKSSQAAVFQLASTTFREDPAAQTAFTRAGNALKELRSSAKAPAKEKLWQLVSGPLDFLWAYTCKESACQLQELWIKEVLVEAQGISDYMKANEVLLGKDGFAVQFIQGPAGPFLSRDLKKGYFAKEVLGRKVAFSEDFLTYMTRGERPVQSSYTVTITGLPTDVNTGAALKPHATHLELQCTNETITLTNLNYPARKVFVWSPQTCGTVAFTIEVGDLILTKEYEGSMGFPRFLTDFEAGKRVFTGNDFPAQSGALKRMGIKYIRVQYRFEGHKPVSDLYTRGPGKAPETIAACWDQ